MTSHLTRIVLAAAPWFGAAVLFARGADEVTLAAMAATLVIAGFCVRNAWGLVYVAIWFVLGVAVALVPLHDYFTGPLGLRDLGYGQEHVITVRNWVALAAAAWVLSDTAWAFFRRDRTPHEPRAERRKATLTSLPIARTTGENQVFWFPAGPGTSVVFIGTTGSGKSGAFWAYIDKLLKWYDQGLIRFYGVDPKIGIELRKAERIFTKLVWQDPRIEDQAPFGERVAVFLEETLKEIRLKLAELGDAGLDKHEPTPDDPWTVILLDELLALTAFMPSPWQGRIEDALGEILTQGRAAGYWVVAATQEANVASAGDVIRQFPVRTCLRVPTATAVDVALGPGIRTEYGAEAHKIPTSTPGVGYVFDSEHNRVERIRFNHVTKEDIARRMRFYPSREVAPAAVVDNVGDGVEVEQGETQPAQPAMVDRVAAQWPTMGTGRRYANVHLGDLAKAIGCEVDDVSDGLLAAGVHLSEVQRRPIGAGREVQPVRALGVEWAEIEPLLGC